MNRDHKFNDESYCTTVRDKNDRRQASENDCFILPRHTLRI